MKLFFVTLTFLSANIYAQSFLDTQEAVKAAKYLDNICMDTFCGGDFIWNNADLSCDKDSCALKMTVMGWSEGDLFMSAEEFESLPEEKKRDKNVALLSAQVVTSDLYTDHFEATEFMTECIFSVTEYDTTLTYNQKEDIIYSNTLDCVNDLEYLLWEL